MKNLLIGALIVASVGGVGGTAYATQPSSATCAASRDAYNEVLARAKARVSSLNLPVDAIIDRVNKDGLDGTLSEAELGRIAVDFDLTPLVISGQIDLEAEKGLLAELVSKHNAFLRDCEGVGSGSGSSTATTSRSSTPSGSRTVPAPTTNNRGSGTDNGAIPRGGIETGLGGTAK